MQMKTKIIIICIIIFSILAISNNIYAKYVIKKEANVTISSTPFYFNAQASSNKVIFERTADNDDHEEILTTETTTELKIQNYEGENFNTFDTTYEITVLEGSKYTFVEGDKITETISGNEKVDKSITLNLKIKDLSDPSKVLKLRVKAIKPYTKSVDITLTVDQKGAIQTIEDLVDLSLSVRGLSKATDGPGGTEGPSANSSTNGMELPQYSNKVVKEKTINELVEEIENGTIQENESSKFSTKAVNSPNVAVDKERFKLTRDLNFLDKNSYENADRADYGDTNMDTITSPTLMGEMTEDAGFLPIGSHDEDGVNRDFHGVFNGDNHTISNLRIHKSLQEEIGLFGYISNANIRNITVTGNIENKNQTAGMIAGKMDGGIIQNAKAEGVVRSFDEVSATRDTYAGGIVGYTELGATIKGCENKATVTTQFTGSVTEFSGPAGGITAWLVDSAVEGCVNRGTVTGQKFVGGIAGFCAINGTGDISNSDNYGKVTVYVDVSASDGPGQDVGGIAGYNGATGVVSNCNNYQSASEYGMDNVGGIAGYNYGKVQNCNNYTADIKAKGTHVGRIVGRNRSNGTDTGCHDYA